ncbi:unnamed protein product [Taenia asiatica]|uniref:Adenomatous polyposis coli protein 2 n=1 Tax=Taenia asiatica TaxID=60517 RepID=A0A158R6T5_TAEAS|nr:unnamed protein product [Taenia asiatica]
MHSQVCPPQPYSPRGPTAQFWRSIDSASGSSGVSNRRVTLMAAATSTVAGDATTMSSPGPIPSTPISHHHSPVARSAPVSPAPPPLPPPPSFPPTRQQSRQTQSIIHFPHQPGGVALNATHSMESLSGMGPKQGSQPRSDRSSHSPADEFAPPSLPPRRNPPPPPPRSGSGLCVSQPLSPQQPPQQQHHSQCLSPDQRRYPAAAVAACQRPSPPQRASVQPPPPPPPLPPPEVVSECVDLEVTNGLLRLLFARFAGTAVPSAGTVTSGSAVEGGAPDLRRVVAHLVRIAHTEIYIQPPSLQTPQRCLEASVGPSGGLLEKMEASIYEQAPPSTAAYLHSEKTFGPDMAVVNTVTKIRKSNNPNDETASISSSSSASSDSASSSDEEEDEDEADVEGADCDLYEGVGGDANSLRVSAPSPTTSTPLSTPKTVSAATANTSASQQTNSTTLLTVAELHALPQNMTIKCLKASAMQALITLVSAYHLDPALRRRDLDIAQLLARIQVYTMTQSERVVAARGAAVAGAEGRLSPDDGKCAAPTHVPVPEVAALVRLSFHPNHRQAICDLGGLHALLSLLRWEHAWWQLKGERGHVNALAVPTNTSQVHSTTPPTGAGLGAAPLDQSASATVVAVGERGETAAVTGAMSTAEASLALRRYICVALTNLTFGAPANKAFVCKRRSHLEALIAQLEVAASVLRNLSWHTDARSKAALRRAQAATRLTRAVLSAQREATLRTTLNALWNLSSHSTANRKAVCSVNGALAFLVSTLDAKNPNKDVEIKANSGGVLRNLCPVIVNSLEYRAVLRTHNCISILLEQLRTSPSVTVVVNVCEVLGALSATPLRDAKPSSALLFESATTDQALMIRLGALDILHRLAHSRHRYVVSSSKQALENLERAHVLIKNQRVVPYPANTEASSFNPSTTTASPTTSNQSSSGSASPTSPAEQVYRRRMSNRSHLRFGLLSVVLETNDDFEEEEESGDEESSSEEDEEEGADEVDSVPEEERSTECSSKVSEAGGEEEAEFKLPEYPPTPDDHHVNTSAEKPPTPPPPPGYAQGSVEEEEQACVYAEEGTPFGPSARASTLDLRSPPKQESSIIYDNFVPSQRRSVHPYVNVDVSNKSTTLKQVSSSEVSSPGFETSSTGAVLETPLMFSRATSSCISSVDFGPLPPIESSPESVYSVALDDDDGDPNEAIALGTSPSNLPPSLIDDGKKSRPLGNVEKIGVVEEETQIMFAEEGSPLDSSSLSGDRESAVAAPPMWNAPEPAVDSVQSSHNILQQCIASVMPSVPLTTQPTVSYPGDGVGAAAAPTEDTIQSFAVEGTPFAFSTKNSSLSDVSITDLEGGCGGTSASSELSKSASPRQSMLKSDVYTCSTEDASSVNEVEEEEGSVNLLSEVIQSALPKQGGFATARGHTEVVKIDSTEDVSVMGHNKMIGGSKLVAPRIGFGHPMQQRRPQATVAPMQQRNVEERQTVSVDENTKSEGKQNSGSDADNSSFSSLLSIESVGVETSLLQECISSAMPTPKLPISSSCRGIGGVKIAETSQQPFGYALPAPSATAPITTPVSPHSQSPSPLAVSEIATSPRQQQNQQQQQVLLQTRRQQSTSVSSSSTGGSVSGLRRAGHFLAHGSGTADAHTSRPETTQIQANSPFTNPTTTNVTSRLVQMMKRTNPKTVVGSAAVPPARNNAAVQALKAPHSMSGIASRDNTETSAAAAIISVKTAIPTTVLKPFEVDKRGTEDEFFPLPPPSGNFDADDDSVTLVGDSSPPWRPSPPSTPPPHGDKTLYNLNAQVEDQDDGLLDLDAMMNQSDDNLDLERGPQKTSELLPRTDLTTPLSIKPPTVIPSSNHQIASPSSSLLRPPTTGLRRPTTGLLSRSRLSTASSSTSSTSSSTSVSPQRLPGARAQSATPSPSANSGSLPQFSKFRLTNSAVSTASSTSLPRLGTPSTRKTLAEGTRSLVAKRSISATGSMTSGLDTPPRFATTPASSASMAVRSLGTSPSWSIKSGVSGRSAPRTGIKSSPCSNVTTTVSKKADMATAPKKVIRTGARSEALAEERQQLLRKSRITGTSSVHRTASARAISPSPHQAPISVARQKSGLNTTRPLSQTSLSSATPTMAATERVAMSGLKPPGFSSSSPSGSALRPPQTRIAKPSAPHSTSKVLTSKTSPPLAGVQTADQWIVRRELTS